MNFEPFQTFEILPPRPETEIPRDCAEAGWGNLVGDLNFFERARYWAQIKKNGTNNVIRVDRAKQLHVKNRHAKDHKAWAPTAASSRVFQRVPGRNWSVFCAELLHSKTRLIKDTNYIYDILVDDGEYLIGHTFMERQARLQAIFLPMIKGKPYEMLSHIVIDDNTWLAKNHLPGTNFRKLFDQLEKVEDEGLVLKDPNSRLELCSNERANRGWQVKCRKATKTYAF